MISISKKLLWKLKVGKVGGQLPDATVLHEQIHCLDDQGNIDYPGKEGNAFEIYCYGKIIYE